MQYLCQLSIRLHIRIVWSCPNRTHRDIYIRVSFVTFYDANILECSKAKNLNMKWKWQIFNLASSISTIIRHQLRKRLWVQSPSVLNNGLWYSFVILVPRENVLSVTVMPDKYFHYRLVGSTVKRTIPQKIVLLPKKTLKQGNVIDES